MQNNPKADLSKKYNLQAMNEYNFDNLDFDVSFGTMSASDVEKMKKEEAEYIE